VLSDLTQMLLRADAVGLDVAERAATTGLVAVREGPPARRTRPHGRHRGPILPSGRMYLSANDPASLHVHPFVRN
jgi:hypothetical protein